jgi:hypothetical protein
VWAVRQGLRNGSIYSLYGYEFSDPAHHLMPPAMWEKRRSRYQTEKSIPYSPELYTDRAQAALRAALAELQDAVADGSVWIGRKDLYFRQDEAEETHRTFPIVIGETKVCFSVHSEIILQ